MPARTPRGPPQHGSDPLPGGRTQARLRGLMCAGRPAEEPDRADQADEQP